MADISDFTVWSSTAASNNPSGGTAVGTGLDDNLRQIQAEVAKWRDGMGYGTLTVTSVGGTGNAITGNTSPAPTLTTNQKFLLVPGATNTGATTLALNSGSAKNIFWNGAACSGGELVIGVPAILEYDGTQLNILGPSIGTRITNALAADVLLNNTSNYFDGPSIAQGTVGTWFASGTVSIIDTGSSANISLKLWDGTTVIASSYFQVGNNQQASMSLSGYITTPAGNLRISAKDASAVTGKILFNGSGNSKDSTIFAIRIS